MPVISQKTQTLEKALEECLYREHEKLWAKKIFFPIFRFKYLSLKLNLILKNPNIRVEKREKKIFWLAARKFGSVRAFLGRFLSSFKCERNLNNVQKQVIDARQIEKTKSDSERLIVPFARNLPKINIWR
jgi:hypothetical protein